MKFAVVDGCPAPGSVAPYIYLVLRQSGQFASSIYRGEDAKALLHRLGKRTQAEIHAAMPSISNPAGRSQHECRSDGFANPGPIGRALHEWEVGIDSGTNDAAAKARIENAAAHFGWRARHPYSRGVEGHHWCFAVKPEANTLKLKAQVLAARVAIGLGPPPLKRGASGMRVWRLKKNLHKLGYLSDKGLKTKGFGALVQSAVIAFQHHYGLTADGIVGPATSAKIASAVKNRKGKR